MLVKNAIDTSGKSCPCGPWIDHYRRHSGRDGKVCYAADCDSKTDLVGAHVTAGGIQYIIPLCKKCNARTDEFQIADQYLTVHAKTLPKCGVS